jgi:anti-sigma B factor antagonist
MNITVNIQKHNEQVHLSISGEIDAYTAPKLRESLHPFDDNKHVQMVVDLSGVSYMDSTGLGVLVGLFKNIHGNEGRLILTGLSPRLKRLFDITGLTEIMEFNTEVEGEVNDGGF